MADTSSEEFASWLRPRDALTKLGTAEDSALKSKIVTLISDGRIRIAGRGPDKADENPDRAPRLAIIGLSYWHGAWKHDLSDFWSLGNISFVHPLIAPGQFASFTIVGSQAPDPLMDIHVFRHVRLDPVAMAHEFDLAPVETTDLPREEVKRVDKGGRRGGREGEPIASVTIRMLSRSEKERGTYTVEALMVELMEEYRALKLEPTSEFTARKNASGILKALRKNGYLR